MKSPESTTPAAHNAFTVTTSPGTHTLCGDIAYTVKDDANAVVGSSDQPMAYDTSTDKFTFNSQD